MLRKTHKTAVVIIPPDEMWPPIQAIRQKHDRQLRRWMPHINLIYPFRPKEEFDVLAEQFKMACRQVTPFEIELARFRFFEHKRESYTIWLDPEPAEPLVRLQETLRQIVPDCDDVNRFPSGFTPHLSVGQVKGRARLRDLLERLQTSWEPLSFAAGQINLIWRGTPPDDIFHVTHVVKLKK